MDWVGRNQRFLLLSGLIAPVFLVCGVMLVTWLSTDHIWVSQYTSALASQNASHELLVRFGLFLPYAILILCFGIGLRSWGPTSLPVKFGSWLLIAYSVSVALGIIYNCDAGCPSAGGSTSQVIHNYASGVGTILIFLVPACFAVYFRHVDDNQPMYASCVVAMFLAAAIIVVPNVYEPAADYVGLVQRATYLVLLAWLVILARYTLGRQVVQV